MFYLMLKSAKGRASQRNVDAHHMLQCALKIWESGGEQSTRQRSAGGQAKNDEWHNRRRAISQTGPRTRGAEAPRKRSLYEPGHTTLGPPPQPSKSPHQPPPSQRQWGAG